MLKKVKRISCSAVLCIISDTVSLMIDYVCEAAFAKGIDTMYSIVAWLPVGSQREHFSVCKYLLLIDM